MIWDSLGHGICFKRFYLRKQLYNITIKDLLPQFNQQQKNNMDKNLYLTVQNLLKVRVRVAICLNYFT